MMRKSVLTLCLILLAGTARAQTFEIIALPDTQFYTESYPSIFAGQTQWIANNQTAENIAFVTQLGDITNLGSSAAQWNTATTNMNTLNAANIPYSVSFGNHDVHWDAVNGDGVANCKTYFGDQSHQGGTTYGGVSGNGLSFYQTFTASGYTLMNINLNFSPDSNTLAWAQQVINDHPNIPTIISTHDYLYLDGQRDTVGNAIWSNLVNNNSQIFMTLNGHYHGQAQLVSTNAAGEKVAQMLSDYQDYTNGGNGYLRKIAFDPSAGEIRISTISTLNGVPAMTDTASQFTYNATFNSATKGIEVTGLKTSPPPVSTTSLVGQWQMNDATGQTKVVDSSPGWSPSWVAGSTPAPNNGVIAGTLPSAVTLGVAGKSGNAIELKNTVAGQGYVLLTGGASNNTATNLGEQTFTLSAWIKRTGLGVGTSTGSGGLANAIPIFCKGAPEADGSNLDANFLLAIDANTNALCADLESFSNTVPDNANAGKSGTNFPVVGTANSLPVNSTAWHHVAATWDGTAWKLYVDGQLNATKLWTDTYSSPQPPVLPRYDSAQLAAIGTSLTSGGGVNGGFYGMVDDVRLYQGALSAADITSLFTQYISAKSLTWNTTNGTWDVTATNWLDGSTATAFTTGDNVNFSQNTNATITVEPNGVTPGTMTVSGTAGTTTFTGGPINGTLIKSGAGNVVFQSPNNLSGVAISAGTADFQAANTFGSVSVSGGNAIFRVGNTFSDVSVSAGSADFQATNTLGSLSVSGGTALLKAANTISSGVTLNGGTIEAQVAGSLGSGTLNLGGGGTLKVASTQTLANPWTITTGGAVLDVADNAVLTFTAATGASSNNLTKNGGGTLVVPVDFGANFTGANIYLNGGTLRYGSSATNFLADQTIVRTVAGTVVDDSYGDGEQFGGLTGEGTYIERDGGVMAGGLRFMQSFSFAGRLTAGTDGVIGVTPNGRRTNVIINSGATVSLTGNTSDYAGQTMITDSKLAINNIADRGTPSAIGVGNIASNPITAGKDIVLGADASASDSTLQYTGPSASSDRTMTLASGTGKRYVEVSNASTKLQLRGEIDGGSLTKSGSGSLDLAAANTYTGGTNVAAGTLLANNTSGSATGTGPVAVASGAKLGGSGTVGGPVTVSGAMAPGNSTGILTVNNDVTFNPGSTFEVDVAGATAGSLYDQLTTSGNVTLGGNLVTNFDSFAPTNHDYMFILNNTGTTTTTSGTFQYGDNSKIGTYNGWDWFISYHANFGATPSLTGGNDVALYARTVPEPSTIALAAMALACGGFYWKRRRSAKLAGDNTSNSPIATVTTVQPEGNHVMRKSTGSFVSAGLAIVLGLLSAPAFGEIIGRWQLDGSAVDSSPGWTASWQSGLWKDNGTLVNGPTYVAGKVGSAIQLDGNNQNIRLTTKGVTAGHDNAATNLGVKDAFSLAAWVKFDSTYGTDINTGGTNAGGANIGAHAYPIITRGRAEGDNSNIDANFFLGVDSNTKKLVADLESHDAILDANGKSVNQNGDTTLAGTNFWAYGSTVVTPNAWHFVTATYDATAGWKLYLDGNLDGTETVYDANYTAGKKEFGTSFSSVAVNVPPLYPRWDSIQLAAIGAAYDSNGNQGGAFKGLIDEVQIYNTALTASNVAYLNANPGAVVPEPSTLALAAMGGLALLGYARRFRTKKAA